VNGLDSLTEPEKIKRLGVEGHRYHSYRARILMVTYVVVFLILLLAFGGLWRRLRRPGNRREQVDFSAKESTWTDVGISRMCLPTSNGAL
jgi:hypothetical protein